MRVLLYAKEKKVNLLVTSPWDEKSFLLQDVLSVGELPVKPNPVLTKKDLIKWPHLQNLTVPKLNGEVMLLIGVNTPEAFWVIEERRGNVGNPYTVRTTLG